MAESIYICPWELAFMNNDRASKKEASDDQKWDEWYDYLADYVEERRKEETKNMTVDEQNAWIWNGNVPIRYKNNDGKSLGRWITTQRAAKLNKSLKEDREVLLMTIGLNWSPRPRLTSALCIMGDMTR